MKSKILKICLVRYANCSPEINVWNIFDTEHQPYIHGIRTGGEGMDPSAVLFERDNFNLTLDIQRMPFFTFLKRKSLMFHYADMENNTVYQYSTFHGILIAQQYTAIVNKNATSEEDKTKFNINLAIHLEGWKVILEPLVRWFIARWVGKTWVEDLEMKLRREKFINLGFRDMVGLPTDIENRVVKLQKLRLPLPKAMEESVMNHPMQFKKLTKLFHEELPGEH